MLQSQSNSRSRAEDKESLLDALRKRRRQMLQSAQQMGLKPDAVFLTAATKAGMDVAKATGKSTSVSILLLFLFTLWKAAKRGCAYNPPPTRFSLPEFISIKYDTFFLTT
jgi:hypothetical protein